MKPATRHAMVLVTAPDLRVARRLARLALEVRAVACANLIPRIESHYWWQGKIESGAEVLIVFKTTRTQLPALEKVILENHPYATPEILSWTLDSGTGRYLDWIQESTAKKAHRRGH